MEKTKIIGVIFFIARVIILALIILSLVWLFPIMTNSGKDEPSEEGWMVSTPNDLNEKCNEYFDKLTNGEEEIGIYDAFDFRMKSIHKYSTGLICLLIMQPCVFLLLALIIAIISNVCDKRCKELIPLITKMWIYLSFIINIIFFTLLYINYNKSKKEDFEDFSECSFVDSDEFSSTYDNVFKVINNMKKLLVTFVIYSVLIIMKSLLEDILFREGESNN